MTVFADYLTVSGTSVSESRIKGSRFIGIAFPCATEDALREGLRTVSEQYPNATHYCYAAVFGGNDRRERSSDNGEPSGTAARPILSVIRGRGLTDTAVAVVRYFGGTLLGTGGLAHAYSGSAEDALSSAVVIMKHACAIYEVRLSYADLGAFNAKCRPMCAVPPEMEYAEDVTVRAAVPITSSDLFEETLSEATSRRARASRISNAYRRSRARVII